MKQNTEKQRAFGELLVHSFPDIPESTIDGWLNNPKMLKERLKGYNGLSSFVLPKGIKVSCPPVVTEDMIKNFLNDESVSYDMEDVLRSIKDWGEEGEVELLPITPATLGFTSDVSYKKLVEQAENFGLRECQNSVIIHASVPYDYEEFTFASAPIRGKLIFVSQNETSGSNWGGGYPYWRYSHRTRHKGKFAPNEIVMFTR